jgi:hypothetical protein
VVAWLVPAASPPLAKLSFTDAELTPSLLPPSDGETVYALLASNRSNTPPPCRERATDLIFRESDVFLIRNWKKSQCWG